MWSNITKAIKIHKITGKLIFLFFINCLMLLLRFKVFQTNFYLKYLKQLCMFVLLITVYKYFCDKSNFFYLKHECMNNIWESCFYKCPSSKLTVAFWPKHFYCKCKWESRSENIIHVQVYCGSWNVTNTWPSSRHMTSKIVVLTIH